jgi:multidrug transporter EmrE-like cation transporter
MEGIVGFVLAGLSALATNVGFLLRHRGAVAAPAVEARHPIRSAVGLFRQKWWSIGYGLAAVAYVFHAGALALVAISAVQAVLAGGIALMAVIAERFFGFHLGLRQWLGVCLAALGLVGLAVTADVREGQASAEYSATAMVAFEGGIAAVSAGLLLVCCGGRQRPQAGVMLAVAAGLLFTFTHVAFKAGSGRLDTSIDGLVGSPHPYLALAGAVVAFFVSARSLQLGPGVAVIAVTAIAGNASAIVAGIAVFGDSLGSTSMEMALRSLAFVLVVAAATLIPAPTRTRRRRKERDADPLTRGARRRARPSLAATAGSPSPGSR